ncbi:MAG: polysaccharide biosynthesis tyrosine autokinase [Bacteroidales bacterium]|nr:polysaccharide biosynthesis tyrosine autokinase [Bacteroidales bacterium]
MGRRGIAETNVYNDAPFVVKKEEAKNNLKSYPVYVTILSENEYKLTIDDKIDIRETLKFGQPFESEFFNFIIEKTAKFSENSLGQKYYFTFNNPTWLTNHYRHKLNIQLNDERGSILTLTSTGNHPQLEADYLNKLSEKYIEYGLEQKNKTAVNTISFIDDQLASVNDSLHSAEDRLQHFRLVNEIVDLSQKGEVFFEQLTTLKTDLAHLKLKDSYLKYLQNYIYDSKPFNEIVAPAVTEINDPVLTTLIDELKRIYTEKFTIELNLRNNYALTEDYNARILSLKTALLKNIENSIATTGISVLDAENRIAQLEKEIQKLPLEERRLISIERDFNVNNNIYNYLLQKRAEASIAKASNVSDDKVLDVALVENSSRIKPNKRMNYMIGLTIGLLLPLLIIILMEYFRNTIDDLKLFAKQLDLPVLGRIKHNKYESVVPVFEHPNTTLSETFRTLRTNMQFLIRKNHFTAITITSADSGEGKTFCALNLSASLVMNGHKTLLAAMDLRKPNVYSNLNIKNDIGISTFLIGKHQPQEIIQTTGIPNLFIAPAGPVPPNPVELLNSEKLKEFFDFAREEFDFVIVDTPPACIVSDVFIINSFCDFSLFVVRMNYTKKYVTEFLEELKEKKALKNINLVINDIKAPHYYGYGYGRYYGYYDSYYGSRNGNNGHGSNGNGSNGNGNGNGHGILHQFKSTRIGKMIDFIRNEN